jgi:hypothetical protein
MAPRNSSRFDEEGRRMLYTEAVSQGLELTQDRDERVSRPVELLAKAIELTPALVLVAPFVVHPWVDGSPEDRHALEIAASNSAGLVRMAHWAREVHARDVGYDTDAWIRKAVALAGHLGHEQEKDCMHVLEDLEEATVHLAEAIVALECDRVAVASSITRAQAGWLAIYVRAREALTT